MYDTHIYATEHILYVQHYLQNLYVTDYQYSLETAPKRHEGTCEWLFENNIFKSWIELSASGMIWIRGLPGSGKTVLSRCFIEKASIEGHAGWKLQKPLIAYFFCSGHNLHQKTEQGFLRTILHQLVMEEQQFLNVLEHADKRTGSDQQYVNSTPALWNCLRKILKSHRIKHKTILIVIDALDEM
ncbi:hypothetical protein EDC01DRAFT_620831, partial [Geopyxis carbonaria]